MPDPRLFLPSRTRHFSAGVKDLKLLKTTQSGYEGFLHDQYTLLPDVKDRIMASSVTATWTYAAGHQPPCFQAAYRAALAAMAEQFFGPPRGGVYSPAVQTTLFNMGKGVLAKVPQAERVFLNMPNLHFLPCTPVVGSKFNNDVYVATSEPHGNIEAVVSRTASKL